jgi:hypothetical protein
MGLLDIVRFSSEYFIIHHSTFFPFYRRRSCLTNGLFFPLKISSQSPGRLASYLGGEDVLAAGRRWPCGRKLYFDKGFCYFLPSKSKRNIGGRLNFFSAQNRQAFLALHHSEFGIHHSILFHFHSSAKTMNFQDISAPRGNDVLLFLPRVKTLGYPLAVPMGLLDINKNPSLIPVLQV